MTETIYGLFKQPELAKRAVVELLRMGLDPKDIDVMSSEPYPDIVFVDESLKTNIPAFALLGGLIGGISGALLAGLTAKSVMLPTGGMPIVAYAPVGIITFALAGLGAIVGALITTLLEAGLLRFKNKAYDGRVAAELVEGALLVSVLCRATDHAEKVERLLTSGGAKRVFRNADGVFNPTDQ